MFRATQILLVLAASGLVLGVAIEEQNGAPPTTQAGATNETARPTNPTSAAPTTPIQVLPPTIAQGSTEAPHQLTHHHDVSPTQHVHSPLPAVPASSFAAGDRKIFDLSHPLNNNTLHWPKNIGFEYIKFFDGERANDQNQTYHVKSDGLHMAVHCGTHLDAPAHFNKNGWTVDKIPIERLVDVPVYVIDVSEKVKLNRSYTFVKEDFMGANLNGKQITPGSVVLVYTGMSALYNEGEEAYMGTRTRNISEMKIPGWGKEAAEYMVELRVYGVGLDSLSVDSSERHGANELRDPLAHVIFNANNIFMIENVNSKLLEMANERAEMRLFINPLPINEGSGSPIRLIAMTVNSCRECGFLVNSGSKVDFPSQIIFSAILLAAILPIYITRRQVA